MADWIGFWSYVRDDDEAEGGRIVQLAEDVEKQCAMLTGEKVRIFVDKKDLAWGDDWKRRMEDVLETVPFFVPVMTPRYFLSPECRNELNYFIRRAVELGVKELVLPLHYLTVQALRSEESSDALIGLVRGFQWEDWRETRFADLASERYRVAVHRLAERLIQASKRAERVAVTRSHRLEQTGDDRADDSPGLLDKLAKMEQSLPEWHQTVEEIAHEIRAIGGFMRDATDALHQSDAQGAGFKGRASITRRLASQLMGPCERVWSLGNRFVAQLHDVDEGVRTIIELVPKEAEEDAASRRKACSFFGAIREFAEAVEEGLLAAQEMQQTIPPIERLARDLRPALRKLRLGLTVMTEAKELAHEWVRLIETSGIRCEEDTD